MENKNFLDVLIILDGPRHRLNKPTLTFGARGIATIQLTTYGPIVPQHSGHFGNYLPNPALRLSKILASMKDENGKSAKVAILHKDLFFSTFNQMFHLGRFDSKNFKLD